MKREDVLHGVTHRIETPLGTAFIIVNKQGHDLWEVFINIGRSGSDVSADSEAIGRLVSMILQPPITDNKERVKRLINQLEDIKGRPTNEKAKSIGDAVAQTLKKEVGEVKE